MGLWLQWAIPRGVVILESRRVRTVIDAEDVTTSVDFQDSYTKIKSRLTSISARMYTQTVDGSWILDTLTNGIVLSCADDLTRDLQLLPNKVLNFYNPEPFILLCDRSFWA